MESVIGWVILAGAAIGLLVSTCIHCSAICGVENRQNGAQAAFTRQLAICVFVGAVGAMFLRPSAVWGIVALCAWLVGYILERRANRRRRAEEEERRKRNALEYPGVFDGTPPDDIDAVQDERLDLFDAGTCTYIGVVDRSDIKALIDAFADMPEQGRNDIFMIPESLERVPDSQFSDEFSTLLKVAFTQRDYLVLRWMPRVHNVK